MLPPSLLTPLSPNACKVYLALLSHFDPTRPAPVQLPMKTLSAIAALAPRTCTRALCELYAAQLLRRLPFRYHHPRSYLFLPFPPQAVPPPQSALLNQTPRPTNPPPQATHTPAPYHAPKTPVQPPHATLLNHSSPPTNPPPQATLLNQSPHPKDPPPQAAHAPSTYTRENLRQDLAQLSPEQRAQLLAILATRMKPPFPSPIPHR